MTSHHVTDFDRGPRACDYDRRDRDFERPPQRDRDRDPDRDDDYGWQRDRDFDRSGPRDRPLIGPEFQSQCIDLYCVWIVSEMTYNVLMGTLNPTHSLTHYIVLGMEFERSCRWILFCHWALCNSCITMKHIFISTFYIPVES